MSEIVEIYESQETLSFKQRWNSYLAVFAALVAVLAGLTMRDNALTASLTYEDLEAGVRAQLPASWLLETEGPDYIFRAQDPAALPFKTLLQVSVLPVGPDATPANVLYLLEISRPNTFANYHVLSRENVTLRDGSEAIRMTYTYVQDERNPFLESLPVVVEGVDVVVLRRSQAVIVTYRDEQSSFDDNLYRFENLLQTLEIF